MKLLISTLALALAAAPTFAQDATTATPTPDDIAQMTCADFAALDSLAQSDVTQQLLAMPGEIDGMEPGTATEDTAAVDAAATGTAADSGAAVEADETTIVQGEEAAAPVDSAATDTAADVVEDVTATMAETDTAAEGQADQRLNQPAAVDGQEALDALALSHVIAGCADDETMLVTTVFGDFDREAAMTQVGMDASAVVGVEGTAEGDAGQSN